MEVLPGDRVRAACNGYSCEYALAGPPVKCEPLDDEEWPVLGDRFDVDRLCKKAFGVGLAAEEIAAAKADVAAAKAKIRT